MKTKNLQIEEINEADLENKKVSPAKNLSEQETREMKEMFMKLSKKKNNLKFFFVMGVCRADSSIPDTPVF